MKFKNFQDAADQLTIKLKADFFSLRANFSTIFEMKIQFPIELNDEELGMNKFFDFQSIIEISSCHFFSI